MSSGEPAREAIEAVVRGACRDPFAVLGPHRVDGGLAIRAFQPDAEALTVIGRDGEALGQLERIDPAGFYSGVVADVADYRLRARRHGDQWDLEDPYRFGPLIGELDTHLFGEGSHRRLWERLGAHLIEHQGIAGTHFAVWAPGARRVSVVGDFNQWDGRRHQMRLHPGVGIWEIFLPGRGERTVYKYEILGADGSLLPLKADPFGFGGELRPKNASVVRRVDRFEWSDGDWRASRRARQSIDAPISIYEVHLGSWRRGEGNRFLSYDEIADQLIPYVQELGFTHIELLPITEFPFDGSWGYQPIGLFAPTSRFGDPAAFARFVDRFHQAGIGVLLDWVPGHFPSDEHGLGRFDGTALYEHEDPRQGFHQDWNTLIYNYGRPEVANYLHANALFWQDIYHLDGLRVDAVASMLYLDYSRKAGEWLPNRHGGRENLEAIDFLKRTNELTYGADDSIMMVAEESTAWPGVSRPTSAGGLGFGYKWNMGWMHDTLVYMSKDPVHRRWHHHQMTFGLLYAFTENFVLPLSHDEVVHGKGTILTRMPGDDWQKFANLRAYYAFMWGHPGKKLLFMGQEFGQRGEWNADRSLDWHLLGERPHEGVRMLVKDLNRLYRQEPALHQLDCDAAGFEWLEASDADTSILAWLRKSRDGRAPVLVVSNFTPTPRPGYRLGLPASGRWREILNTDADIYGGSGMGNLGMIETEEVASHGRPYSARMTLPPLATVWFRLEENG
ncbi:MULTISPECIES: 1,4-alpha-glucan branching protein GlgB [Rhodomicrobium]|uniref:1,4-alpha-glucan branching protein GlgB n=1 Tax=Rhodomicrobium TaxID=1068 RepID=UPI000B4A8D58|nr:MULTISPECIES: 1,4-alpha-glucan branching protein GlgB [Rhodomicrobium]